MPIPDLSQGLDRLTHEQMHTTNVLDECFDALEFNSYRYTHHDIWDVLLYASMHRVATKTKFANALMILDNSSLNKIYYL